MSDLEFDIRQLARDLQRLYTALDEKKYERPKPPEIRTMIPSPGPSEPGSFLWLNRSVLMEQRLREVGFNALGDIGVKLQDRDGVAHNLLERIAFNAQPISELAWADDFLDELDSQARQLGKWLNPKANTHVVNAAVEHAPRRYTAADAAALASAATGRNVTRKQVTYWGRSKTEVSTQLNEEGVTTYELGEVVAAARNYKDAREKSG